MPVLYSQKDNVIIANVICFISRSYLKFATLLLVIALLIGRNTYANNLVATELIPLNHYFSQNWGTQDGLPHNSIHALAQTADGYIWAGTWEGVARFNGKQFRVFTRGDETGLPDSGIRSLYFHTQSNALLVAGNRGGVSTVSQGRWTPFTSLSSMVNHAYKTSDNSLWFALEDGGVEVHKSNGHIFHYYQNTSAYRIIEDRRGVIWVATNQGLFHYVNDEFVLAAPQNEALTGPSFTLALDEDGNVLVGTEHGVWRQRQGDFEALHTALNNSSISSILVDHQQSIWIGTINQGVYRLSELGLESLDFAKGLPDNRVFALLEDTERNIWIGTNGGLLRLRRALFTTYTQNQGLSGDFVRSVLQTHDGRILVGGSAGLNILNNGTFTEPSSMLDTPVSVLSLTNLPDDSVLVGTYTHGVLRLVDDTLHPFLDRHTGLPSNEVRAILVAKDHAIWIATAQGVVRRDPAGRLDYFDDKKGMPAQFTMGLAQDTRDRIWLATGNGLSFIADNQIHRLEFPPGSDARHAFSFHVVNEGVWIATDRGIGYFDNDTSSIKMLGVAQGLPVDKIFAITFDAQGRVWMSSNQGVILTQLSDLQRWLENPSHTLSFEHFKEESGLVSRQINGGSMPSQFVDSDGNVWFSSARGLSFIQPDHLDKLSHVVIPVNVEKVLLDGEMLRKPAQSNVIDIEPSVTRITFQYAGLGFSMPSRIEYQVMLEGYDDEWVNRHDLRIAEYTNLAPGEYIFNVRSRYAGGVWQGQSYTMLLNVKPYVYQTLTFKILACSVLILVIGLMFKWRVEQLKKSEANLRQRVAEQTRSLEIQSRKFEYQANHDELTGSFNRRAFDKALVHWCERATANKQPLSLAIVDIDNFKMINDRYSHLTGDKVIATIASLIEREIPLLATCARWGGEEFAVLLPDMTLPQAKQVMEHLRKAVEVHSFSEFALTENVTVSIGVADLETTGNYNRLLSNTDKALYQAKQYGRNRVVII